MKENSLVFSQGLHAMASNLLGELNFIQKFDWSGPIGTPIHYALESGSLVSFCWREGWHGLTVDIDHRNTLPTVMLHLCQRFKLEE